MALQTSVSSIGLILAAFVLGPLQPWTGASAHERDANRPATRQAQSMAYDAARGRVVLFGGHSGALFTGDLAVRGDTWEWDGANWTRVTTKGPSPRTFHAMAFDSARRKVVLVGGSSGGSETWEWDGSSWTLVANTTPDVEVARELLLGHRTNESLRRTRGPGARVSHAMSYDTDRKRMVLFGGEHNGPLGDTWEWDGIAWAQTSTNGPQARHQHAMAFDEARHRTVMNGGSRGSNETWEWDGKQWSLASHDGPANREHALIYDPMRGHVQSYAQNGVALEWDGHQWSEIDPNEPAAALDLLGSAVAGVDVRLLPGSAPFFPGVPR